MIGHLAFALHVLKSLDIMRPIVIIEIDVRKKNIYKWNYRIR